MSDVLREVRPRPWPAYIFRKHISRMHGGWKIPTIYRPIRRRHARIQMVTTRNIIINKPTTLQSRGLIIQEILVSKELIMTSTMARTTGIAKLCSTLTIRKIVSILTEEVILMEVAEHRITLLFGWSPGIIHFWKVQRRQNGKRR